MARPGWSIAAALAFVFCLLLYTDILPTPHHTAAYSSSPNAQRQTTSDAKYDADTNSSAARIAGQQAMDDVAPSGTHNPPTAVLSEPLNPTTALASNKTLIMAKLSSEDTTWTTTLTDWDSAIYTVDLPSDQTSPTGHRTRTNKGRESLAYLTYIVDHYPYFPTTMAFVHAHASAPHNADHPSHTTAQMLTDLRPAHVQQHGYANLRCQTSPTCAARLEPFRDASAPAHTPARAYPYVYAHFFDVAMSTMFNSVARVGGAGGGQFAVSREQVLARPKEDYELYLRFVEDSHYDDATLAGVMEFMWQVVFGRGAVDCPEEGGCRCDLYGYCGED